MTNERHLGTQAEEHPDRSAIVMAGSGLVTTYQELNERSNQVAHLLRDAGLRTGDHIALMMENGSEFLEVAWGRNDPVSITPPSTVTCAGARHSTFSMTVRPWRCSSRQAWPPSPGSST